MLNNFKNTSNGIKRAKPETFDDEIQNILKELKANEEVEKTGIYMRGDKIPQGYVDKMEKKVEEEEKVTEKVFETLSGLNISRSSSKEYFGEEAVSNVKTLTKLNKPEFIRIARNEISEFLPSTYKYPTINPWNIGSFWTTTKASSYSYIRDVHLETVNFESWYYIFYDRFAEFLIGCYLLLPFVFDSTYTYETMTDLINNAKLIQDDGFLSKLSKTNRGDSKKILIDEIFDLSDIADAFHVLFKEQQEYDKKNLQSRTFPLPKTPIGDTFIDEEYLTAINKIKIEYEQDVELMKTLNSQIVNILKDYFANLIGVKQAKLTGDADGKKAAELFDADWVAETQHVITKLNNLITTTVPSIEDRYKKATDVIRMLKKEKATLQRDYDNLLKKKGSGGGGGSAGGDDDETTKETKNQILQLFNTMIIFNIRKTLTKYPTYCFVLSVAGSLQMRSEQTLLIVDIVETLNNCLSPRAKEFKSLDDVTDDNVNQMVEEEIIKRFPLLEQDTKTPQEVVKCFLSPAILTSLNTAHRFVKEVILECNQHLSSNHIWLSLKFCLVENPRARNHKMFIELFPRLVSSYYTSDQEIQKIRATTKTDKIFQGGALLSTQIQIRNALNMMGINVKETSYSMY